MSSDNERAYEVVLLALAIWREARGEDPDAWKAVGCSIRNRVRRPTWWGHNYVDVITKKWQYSSMAAPGDPQLILYPQYDDPKFDKIIDLSKNIIDGLVLNPVPGADSYYDDSIPAPKWAKPENFVAKIGTLNFHNVDGDIEGSE